MKIFTLVSIFFFFSFSVAEAQVSLVEDGSIGSMVQQHITKNKSIRHVSGWRLQLIASPDRQKVMDAKAAFLSRYPNYSAEWVYKAPYYKLNVGAYRTKLEATALKQKLKYDYPNAYITKDNHIRPSEMD